MLFIEIPPDNVGSLLGAPEVPADVSKQFFLICWATTTKRVALDVLIEQFIGIELRTVPGKEVDPDAAVLALEPLLHGCCTMYGMPVEDQEDASLHLPQQPLQEGKEHR